jgi:hypothetical protein
MFQVSRTLAHCGYNTSKRQIRNPKTEIPTLGRDGIRRRMFQLRRSGMFIAREPKQDPRKPHGGGMVARGGHVAPTELEGISGGRLL